MQALVLMVGQILWNILSLIAKAPLGLVLYIQLLLETWKLPSVIPTTQDQGISESEGILGAT